MKYRFSGIGYRIAAYFLAAACLAVGFLSSLCTVVCLDCDFYDKEWVYQTTGICRSRADYVAQDIIAAFQDDPTYSRWDRLLAHSSMRFLIVEEETGKIVASYLDGLAVQVPDNLKDNIYSKEYNPFFELGEEDIGLQDVYVADSYFGDNWISDVSSGNDGESYQLLLLLPQEMTRQGKGDIIWDGYDICQTIRQYRSIAPAMLGICAVAGAASLIFLLCQAGHLPGQEVVQGNWLERIFLEFWFLAGALAVAGIANMTVWSLQLMDSLYSSGWDLTVLWGLLSLAVAACGMVVIGALDALTVRIKQGRCWNGLLSWHILSWCFKKSKKILSTLHAGGLRFLSAVGMVPRAALALTGAALLSLLFSLWFYDNGSTISVLLWLCYHATLLAGLIWAIAQMKILQNSARTMAEGDLEHQVDTAHMYWDFKQHGAYLNAISDGMNKAVEKQMRSERLKTELITNVSHDIKTPLTSIVNYVDLLQKPHSGQEQAQYLEVLDRQARRLKRLTENLVEASKASTGNVSVHLDAIHVLELVNQAMEEYRDRMEAGKLETVVSLRGDLLVLADGKLMWRVLDNLLNNVIKYAMPGTRVYVTAEKWEKRVVIAIKNISREPLNVDADELMERFVRGDSSRHTEGSGLGLNIAKSLTELQHGELKLTVDGDLFKAEISLPVAPKPEENTLAENVQ